MLVDELGEFGLLHRLTSGLAPTGADVVVGIGDDAAVLRVAPGQLLLATCDTLVEGVHFTLATTTPELLGRKALAVNLSDVAAMGGVPRYALLSLALSNSTPVELVDGLYTGLRQEANRYGVALVGGNLSRSSSGLVVDVMLLGEVEPEGCLRRSGAKMGDAIMVTGYLGNSAAGLSLLLEPVASLPKEVADFLANSHRLPVPRVAEGRVIGGLGMATAMIDLSDGLASDLGHLCQASQVGALVWAESLPISDEVRQLAAVGGRSALDFALYGGEDYELLFTVRTGHESEVAEAVMRTTGTKVTKIGQVASLEAGICLADGRIHPLPPQGHDHFRSARPR